MKRFITLLLLFTYTAALAGDAVIWNGQFGKFLPAQGFRLFDLKEYRSLTVDPSAGAGIAAPIGSVGVRDNAGVGEAWFKAGAADTVWTNILTGLTGWTLTGNTGTDDTINFLGTTDAEDLSIKANNVTRVKYDTTGRVDHTPDGEGDFTSGAVAPVVADYNQQYMGQAFSTVGNNYFGPYLDAQFSGAITGSYYGLTDSPDFGAASSVPFWNGVHLAPNFIAGSTVASGISAMQFVSTIPAGVLTAANVNGYSMNPVIDSDMAGYNGFNDATQINAAIGGYNGYSVSTNFGAASNMASIFKGINIQPNVTAGATFPSGNGIFVGGNVAAGVTINDWTDITTSSDIDAAINTYASINTNPQGSGNITSAQLINVGSNLSGDNGNVTGINVTGTVGDDVTSYTGLLMNQAATGTVTNVTGISINNSGLNSPNQKTGINVTDGNIQVSGNYDTSILAPSPGFVGINSIGGTYTVGAGFPVTATGVIGSSLGVGGIFHDDMGVDGFGGLLGFTSAANTSGLSIDAGKTVDHVNVFAGALTVPAGSSGAVTSMDGYLMAGLQNGGGTVDVTGEFNGFHAVGNICTMVSGKCYGLSMDDAAAANYSAGNFGIGTVTKSSIGTTPFSLQVAQNTTDLQAGAIYATNQAHFTVNGFNFATGANVESKVIVDAGVSAGAALANQFSAYRNSGAIDDGTLAYLAGAFGGANQISTGAAATSTVAAGIITQQNLTSGNVTNAYDFYALGGVLTGSTITNRYGIYIEPDDIGTKYNFLSGRTVLGTTYVAPTRELEVQGSALATGDIKTETSLTVEDPGAGTNAVTVQAGTMAGDYTVTLPVAQGAANTTLVNDGAGVLTWGAVNATPTLFGTRQTGRSIVAGTGITSGASHMSTTAARQLIFVVGASGGTDITANPQIEAGTTVGQEMQICGTSDDDWVQLDTDDGLAINGTAVLGKDDCITLTWLGSDGSTSVWGERSRTF